MKLGSLTQNLIQLASQAKKQRISIQELGNLFILENDENKLTDIEDFDLKIITTNKGFAILKTNK